MEPSDPNYPKPVNVKRYINVFFAICLLIIFSYYLLAPPIYNRSIANREPTIIHISRGESASEVSSELANMHAVRFASVLRFFIASFKLGRPIAIGDYQINPNAPVWSIAWQIARSHHNINPIKITFPEGVTNEDMAQILAEKILLFRRDLFLTGSDGKQGYLFPDTYFFYAMSTTDEILGALESNFNKKIAPLATDIKNSTHSEKEIIIMASIIQKEAKNEDDSYIISGILWKRINNGMLLQVDAAPSTYSRKGLPTDPISNPGLIAIKAALYPEDSPYLYYVHDKNGVAHFASTFAEHRTNISRYLK